MMSQPHAGPEAPHDGYHDAQEECDLVMKGGITSGVVYPRAVLKLARRYRFRSIGGTSAGAIAAAATAAAEYGRHGAGGQGFDRLDQVAGELEQAGMIANLFQPEPALRPLMAGLLEYLDIQEERRSGAAPPSVGSVVGAARRVVGAAGRAGAAAGAWRAGLAGALVGFVLGAGWLAALLWAGSALALIYLLPLIALVGLGWWLGRMAGVVYATLHLLGNELAANQYGLCRGLPVEGHPATSPVADATGRYSALTTWLSETLDGLAGLGTQPDALPWLRPFFDDQAPLRGKRIPLTFGHLRHNHQPEVDRDRQIVLQVVTTNLSQGQPYVLPFEPDVFPFLFSKEEFEQYFPAYVVDYLVAVAHEAYSFQMPAVVEADDGRRHTLYFLPPADRLPVIVATRMSLSYPLLLSAVPLWTVRRSVLLSRAYREGRPYKLGAGDVQHNWFSDGGISSNFPIHFFDSWFPTRPTFGINLGSLPREALVAGDRAEDLRAVDAAFESATWRDQPSGWRPGLLGGARQRQRLTRTVDLPSSFPSDQPNPQWRPLDGGLPELLWWVVDTALFYRDTLQSRLPSYYDRIVTVRLSADEGGLNLAMPPETIKTIADKGRLAGERILNQFRLDHHQWVRLLLLLSEIEEQVIGLRRGVLPQDTPPLAWETIAGPLRALQQALEQNGPHNAVNELIQAQLRSLAAGAPFPYRRDSTWDEEASARFLLLLLLIEMWGQADDDGLGFFSRSIPPDRLVPSTAGIRLRVTPEL